MSVWGAYPEDHVELLGGVEKCEIVTVDHDPGWARKITVVPVHPTAFHAARPRWVPPARNPTGGQLQACRLPAH
jgi:hypothetical protein